MKKGQILEGKVTSLAFPAKGKVITKVEEEGEIREYRASVKNVLPGQTIAYRLTKKSHGNFKGEVQKIIEKGEKEVESPCPHFGFSSKEGPCCGGCLYQTMEYKDQLELKNQQLSDLFSEIIPDFDSVYEGVLPSPEQDFYRNKMEYSFGDSVKGGPLELGMHRRGSFYDVLTVDHCCIAGKGFNEILQTTRDFFREKEIAFYRKGSHRGYLRHLLVRKAHFNGEILVDLVTADYLPDSWESVEGFEANSRYDGLRDERGGLHGSHPKMTQEEQALEQALLAEWKDRLLALEEREDFDCRFAGILHTRNNSVADAVKDEGTRVLYGQDYFTEKLLGLSFKVTPFSFFQTNSAGAEVLYQKARDYIMEGAGGDLGNVVYDLYSGTGTIAQILSPAAKEVIGVEIVEEAVEDAKVNAEGNGLCNCHFLAGDVLKVLDDVEQKPDYIILDPPREGLHPKAMAKIVDYQVPALLYIACKPTSLQRDLPYFMEHGYHVKKICGVDMFPFTPNVEAVCQLSK